MNTLHCPACKDSASRRGNFCYRCGTKLVTLEKRMCPCGYKNDPTIDTFCEGCGQKLPPIEVKA